MSKRIFVDLHHAGLYRSLQLLFEDRLGYELYRPIGTEWHTKGYWQNAKIYGDAPETISQYLAIRDATPTKMGMKNTIVEEHPDYYLVEDEFKKHKAITYDQFMANPPDVVIASYFENIECYKRLADSVGAKFIAQYGNVWPTRWDIYDNLLASVHPDLIRIPTGKKAVFYHQEFDLNIYRYGEPNPSNLIRSFVHCLPEHDIYTQDWIDFQELEKLLPEYKLESYGISCREGTVTKQEDVADKMRQSRFGLHFKNHGDGFGHTIHSWLAVGRPVIYKGSQYQNRLAGELLIDGVTGFDLEKRGMNGIVESIRNLKPEEHLKMCQQAHQRFSEIVNYDKEAREIKQFMEDL